ncbi:unnamed protein product [Ceutorhynchus assimilis]|uniref:Bifunctional coenzyme A synthase n=1 Tax=Ceutorhynchus assimilis TaxID=467358 RepID=A0A9N9N0Q2_9CUCU|nr:unnamed protein product [Ceutorhynchus assimilis]
MAKTGLLIVSNPKHITKLLSDISKTVQNTLYIQLLSALSDPLGSFHANVFSAPPKFSRTIYSIYSQATQLCNNLDVRVLLSGLKSAVPQIKTLKPIDIVIFDKKYNQIEIDNFIKNKVPNIVLGHKILTVECCASEKIAPEPDNRDEGIYKHVCLGGTFDRLHTAHKLLLSDAILRASDKVTVGMTEENMIHSKILWELIQDIDTRIEKVNDFVTDVCPELTYDIMKISDPFGPAIVDPTMGMIMVSEETVRGGELINEIRRTKNLEELKIVAINFIEEPNPQPKEEHKVSSSNLRLRLLGTLIKPLKNKNIPNKPYVIGLTGGIASGKSGVATHLHNLGAAVIDCDKIAHRMYSRDGPSFQKVIDQFGNDIINFDGEIDRRMLGDKVFNKPVELKKLTDILWPEMAKEINRIIKILPNPIICVEAAVLCQAGWDQFCHEVWITLVPQRDAIQRLVTRNNLDEEQAKNRLESQPSNKEYVENANVIICPLWEVAYTKSQVEKAWGLLQHRLSK